MSQLVFALTSLCCVLNGQAAITNFIVFGLTLTGIETQDLFYHNRDDHANDYITKAVVAF